MYTLIADSGSTKTDWVLMKGSTLIKEIKTNGFNPYFQTREQIIPELIAGLKPHLADLLGKIDELYYYGAGCSTTENCAMIKDCLNSTIEIGEIHVAHDLLASARAVCKNEPGIACILGTGSNSCLFNGETIIENVPSFGYLWGDYGSGAQIGKYFIKHYFEETLPKELRSAFEEAGYNREVILNGVYKNAMPSRYLASLNSFVNVHISHPFIKELVKECFNSFFVHQVNKYTSSKKYKVHSVGSIGFYYKEFLLEIASDHGYEIGNIIRSPIDGLMEFHS